MTAALVRWPADVDRRLELARAGVPCLLVVDPGTPVPPLAATEDWVSARADERDAAARLDDLARSAAGRAADVEQADDAAPMAPLVLPDGLGAAEHVVAVRLALSEGRLVSRSELRVPRVDQVVAALALALAPLGWQIHAVGDSGFLLERIEGSST